MNTVWRNWRREANDDFCGAQAFKDWGDIFPNAACVTALLDRLTHHAEIIPITGESYRRREAEAAQKARRKA